MSSLAWTHFKKHYDLKYAVCGVPLGKNSKIGFNSEEITCPRCNIYFIKHYGTKESDK